MKRDTGIYEKYLNMKPKEKKKIDFSVKFENKTQKIGVIMFGVGLILLCLGFIFMFAKKYDDHVEPQNEKVLKNVNVKDFESISTEDGLVNIGTTTVTYKKSDGVSELNIILTTSEDIDELPIKIIFDLNGEEVVFTDYLQDITAGNPISIYKQYEDDLTMADSWRVEVTTKEDLQENWGFTFDE